MRRREELFDIVKDMEYHEAVVKVNTAVSAQVTNIASRGDYSREAVEEAEKLLAAWLRVQRG
tara:strand:+ start:1495 stop:1680 length:186 start_codon:yes stop_codon:yes gene_type:complete